MAKSGVYGKVDVLEREESGGSVGERFGRAFAEAAKKAATTIPDYLIEKQKKKEKETEDKKKDIAVSKAKLLPSMKQYLSFYDKNESVREKDKRILQEKATELIEQGIPEHEAIDLAYQEMFAQGGQIGEQEKEPQDESFFAKGKGAFTGTGGKEFLKDLGIGAIKGVRTGVALTQTPWEKAQELKKRAIAKLMGVSDEEFEKKERIQQENMKAGQEFLGVPENYQGKGTLGIYDELTGNRGLPENVVERIAQGIPLGLPGVAGEFTNELLGSAGLPESVQEAGGFLSFLFAHKIKMPALKTVIGKAEKSAKASGKSVEEVLETAQRESGISAEQLAHGDPQAIKMFKDKITEAPKSAEKVSETPKTVFNKKAAQKEREVFGNKIAESPLEDYYEIRAKEAQKEAGKGPEVKAREREVRERLAPEEKRLFEEVRNKKEQLQRINKAQITARPEESVRIEALYKAEERAFKQKLEELKDVQYEMKYARPRATEAEIDAQIENSVEKYKEGIKNPTEKTIADVNRQLELDKKYLDRAEKLIDRGELPGEIRPDTFLKMKTKYIEGYKAAIENAKAEMKQQMGETSNAAKKTVQKNRDLIKILEGRLERLRADVVNQTDNIKAMRALEKPSGAFYKQQIKSLKKDQALFKHDLFKQSHVKSQREMKTGKVFSEQAGKIGENVIKEPTPENVKKASEEMGKPKETIKKEAEKAKKENEEVAQGVKKGTLTPNQEAKWSKNGKRLAGIIGGGLALGAVMELSTELGYKPNAKIVKWIYYYFTGKQSGFSTIGRDAVRMYFDNAQANELHNLRGNPAAFNDYVNNMQKKHGTAKKNRVKNLEKEL